MPPFIVWDMEISLLGEQYSLKSYRQPHQGDGKPFLMSRLGGVVGLSFAICTQSCGFDPSLSRWIFMMQKIDSGHVVGLYGVGELGFVGSANMPKRLL
ncbi:hypothetical protein TNCV_2474201 [Trichonephila clavipes]|nr:hypothetical protein TNCV_2474201 [Trichonephila clavipes]